MAEHDLVEELDRAAEALMGDRPPTPSAAVADLLRVAADLRCLPRDDFRARLRSELGAAASATVPPSLLAGLDVAAIARDLPTLAITPETTAAQADAATRQLAWLGERILGVVRFSGTTPWERHPDGDELLQVLDGEVEVTVLAAEGPAHVRLRTGALFVCPQGLWHRQRGAPVTLLFATPARTTEISWADDPRVG